jgi:hypothetical protein
MVGNLSLRVHDRLMSACKAALRRMNDNEIYGSVAVNSGALVRTWNVPNLRKLNELLL